MLSIHSLARSSAAYLVARLPESRDKPEEEVVSFGLEVIIGVSLQLIVFIITAGYLNMMTEMMAILITMSSYRLLSGGVHCSAYYRCLILSLATLISLAYLGRWLAFTIERGLPSVATLIFVVGLVTAWRWAPADTPAAPIVNPARRARLKKASYGWLMAWLLVILAGFEQGWPGATLVASCLAVLFQSFALTPLGFAAVGQVDALLKRLLPLG